MMKLKLYTSYFGNIRNTDSDSYLHVSIARFPPDFFKKLIEERINYRSAPAFMPSADLLSRFKAGECTEEDYKREFITQVDNFIYGEKHMEINEYMDALDAEFSSKYEGIIFYCFETPEKFCHRHLLARFFEVQGYPCTEIQGKLTKKKSNALF